MASKKQIIKERVTEYLQGFVGEEVYGVSIFLFACGGKYTYPDTVFRYMREMREDKLIGYDCRDKMHSKYKINFVCQPSV